MPGFYLPPSLHIKEEAMHSYAKQCRDPESPCRSYLILNKLLTHSKVYGKMAMVITSNTENEDALGKTMCVKQSGQRPEPSEFPEWVNICVSCSILSSLNPHADL